MKIRARKAHARVDKVAAGFTIIETILFLAIAAMVFTGVIVGTNGAIRRQRYKDAVQSFTDDIRELYSLAENTEVLDYTGNVSCGLDEDGNAAVSSHEDNRGRSDCSVYGVIARFQMNSGASTGTGENLEAYWLIGNDERKIDASIYRYDSTFLAKAKVKPIIRIGSNTKIEAKTSSLFWGAQLAHVCDNSAGDDTLVTSTIYSKYCYGKPRNYIESSQLYYYLMIYRSPITGAIRTMAFAADSTESGYKDFFDQAKSYDLPLVNSSVVNDLDKKEDVEKFSENPSDYSVFNRRKVNFCIIAGDGMSYDGGLRMVSIEKDASTMNDVILVEADSGENKCNE